MPATKIAQPSARLAGLLEGDLSGYKRESDGEGWVRFVPDGNGPAFDVASRIEKRFLGRTEIAVFRADLDVSVPESGIIEMRHTGRLKRTGVTAVPVTGGDVVRGAATALASDGQVAAALQPLDFTRFEILLSPDGCGVEVELMGASHVAVALPPIRSYVHLYPDQLAAMRAGIEAVRTVLLGTV